MKNKMKVDEFGCDLKKPSIFQMDPFLIFSAQNRTEVALANPNLSPSIITSILSSMWKKLDKKQKQIYYNIAEELGKVQEPLKKINSNDKNIPNLSQNSSNIPNINLFPRNGFGHSASEASLLAFNEN